MAKSIMQENNNICYLCKANGTMDYLHWHHVFGGANRKWSEKYGLKVRLCGQQCHENGPDTGNNINAKWATVTTKNSLKCCSSTKDMSS